MITNRQQLRDVFQTAREMQRLTCSYWQDLGAWLRAPFIQYFNFVCALPYFEDPEECETVSRPLYTLNPSYRPRDCDDKSVLLASWIHGNGGRCRFIAVSTQKSGELNHVFVQAADGTDLDATYPEYHNLIGKYPYLGAVTARENLTEWF